MSERQNTVERGFVSRHLKSIALSTLGAAGAIFAIADYRRGRPINHAAWHSMLRAHCASNAWFTDLLDPLLRAAVPPRKPAQASGLLGTFSIEQQRQIANQLEQNGFYVFKNLLPADVCDGLEEFARQTPASVSAAAGGEVRRELYDAANLGGRLYKFDEADAFSNAATQRLLADEALLRIAETYLGTRTVVGGLDTWWSAPYGNGPDSDAAQMFHFDFDAPPRWLKLFVYVTPVGPDTGPHIYMRGSHRLRSQPMREILSRGYVRVSDEEIEAAFGAKNTTEITGARGTVFLADTRGFHKGKFPTAGDRLITQLIYCSPVFNNHGPPPKVGIQRVPELAAAVEKYPDAYQRYCPMPNKSKSA